MKLYSSSLNMNLDTVSRNSMSAFVCPLLFPLGTAKHAAHMFTADNIENSLSLLTSSLLVSVNERQRVTHIQLSITYKYKYEYK